MTAYRCDHIHLKAENVQATVRWYCDCLGGRVIFEGQFRGSSVFYVDIGGTTFIIFGRLANEPDPIEASLRTRYGVDHFGFEVADLDQAVAELRTKGVPIVEEPTTTRPGLRIAYIEGPDKARIELSQRDRSPIA